MILIADSGSTKCDWILVNRAGDVLGEYHTIGLNPYFHDEDEIHGAIQASSDLAAHAEEVNEIYFYGAGSSSEKLCKVMEVGLVKSFANAKIYVEHDLKGAAFAAYTGEPNITCILGTGSNSCYFNGDSVHEEVPSLAYILGDEGSGSFFGKKLLQAYFYKRLPAELAESFEKKYALSVDELTHRVYNEPHANVYLASFMKFLGDHKEHELFQTWVLDGIRLFITLHVKCFENWNQVPVHFIGSVGHYFRPQLEKACELEGITLGQVIKKPIYSLVDYHVNWIFSAKQA